MDRDSQEIVASYLPTQKSLGVLENLFLTFDETNRDRATAIIAPYGSGKSSLLLLLLALLAGDESIRQAVIDVQKRIRPLSPTLAETVQSLITSPKGYIVVVLSGDEGPLEERFAVELNAAFKRAGLARLLNKIDLPKEQKALEKRRLESLSAQDLYRKAAAELTRTGYKGIVVIYDEFGKVLEAQQMNPRPADLFFLQSFAEISSRSGKNQIHLILSLHQGFTQYAHRLPVYIRNEWAKIEGRFRTFHFVEDSLQVYDLIGQATKKLRNSNTAPLVQILKRKLEPYVSAAQEVPHLAHSNPPWIWIVSCVMYIL